MGSGPESQARVAPTHTVNTHLSNERFSKAGDGNSDVRCAHVVSSALSQHWDVVPGLGQRQFTSCLNLSFSVCQMRPLEEISLWTPPMRLVQRILMTSFPFPLGTNSERSPGTSQGPRGRGSWACPRGSLYQFPAYPAHTGNQLAVKV